MQRPNGIRKSHAAGPFNPVQSKDTNRIVNGITKVSVIDGD
jgi:hypothetical protein